MNVTVIAHNWTNVSKAFCVVLNSSERIFCFHVFQNFVERKVEKIEESIYPIEKNHHYKQTKEGGNMIGKLKT